MPVPMSVINNLPTEYQTMAWEKINKLTPVINNKQKLEEINKLLENLKSMQNDTGEDWDDCRILIERITRQAHSLAQVVDVEERYKKSKEARERLLLKAQSNTYNQPITI
jgi:acetolactate synthase small subunit